MSEPYKTQVKNSLYERLQYMRMIYSCLFKVSLEGGSCMEPLFLFYDQDEIFDTTKDSFIYGKALRITANFTEKPSFFP